MAYNNFGFHISNPITPGFGIKRGKFTCNETIPSNTSIIHNFIDENGKSIEITNSTRSFDLIGNSVELNTTLNSTDGVNTPSVQDRSLVVYNKKIKSVWFKISTIANFKGLLNNFKGQFYSIFDTKLGKFFTNGIVKGNYLSTSLFSQTYFFNLYTNKDKFYGLNFSDVSSLVPRIFDFSNNNEYYGGPQGGITHGTSNGFVNPQKNGKIIFGSGYTSVSNGFYGKIWDTISGTIKSLNITNTYVGTGNAFYGGLETQDGGFIFVGNFYSNLEILKVNSSGSKVNSKKINETPYQILEDIDGTIILLTTSGSLVRLSSDLNTIISSTKISGLSYSYIKIYGTFSMALDTNYIYVFNNNNKILILDKSSLIIQKEIDLNYSGYTLNFGQFYVNYETNEINFILNIEASNIAYSFILKDFNYTGTIGGVVVTNSSISSNTTSTLTLSTSSISSTSFTTYTLTFGTITSKTLSSLTQDTIYSEIVET